MACDIDEDTVNDPDEGDATYRVPVVPDTGEDADQEYVPDTTLLKTMLVDVLEDVAPLKVALQEVPLGSPDSLNVTE